MRKIAFLCCLVLIVPLSGCIDPTETAGAIGQSFDGEDNAIMINHPPVIFGSVVFGDYYHGPNNRSFDVLSSMDAFAIDFDGNITEFGIDVNLDGIIDFPIDQSVGGPSYRLVNGTEENTWKMPVEVDAWGTGDVEYCQQPLAIIAVDDEGEISVKPFFIRFDYDSENGACLLTT